MNPTRALRYFLLALLLFLAQEGAVLHVYSHFQQENHSAADKVCDQCASFAEMAGAVSVDSLNFTARATVFSPIPFASFFFHPAFVAVFAARGPPLLS